LYHVLQNFFLHFNIVKLEFAGLFSFILVTVTLDHSHRLLTCPLCQKQYYEKTFCTSCCQTTVLLPAPHCWL